MKYKQIIFVLLIIIILIFLINNIKIKKKIMENIKKPVAAGNFYPANKITLEKQLNNFFENIDINYNNEDIKAIIVPHAGYIYSGQTAMYAFKSLYYSLLLDSKKNYKIIILAPAHTVYFKGIATLSNNYYETPLGTIKIADNNLQRFNNDLAFEKEHSVEVELPFLQYIFKKANKKFEILPILIGDETPENVLNNINSEITDNTIFVVSSDLSHFLKYTQAIDRDNLTIQEIINNKKNIDACGKIGIITLNKYSVEKKYLKKVLKYSNSGEMLNKSSVVGYVSIIYYTKDKPLLIRLARKTIYNKLNGIKDNFNDLKEVVPKEYLKKQGVFVTINKNKQLRGCIGNIYATDNVFNLVIDNAKNAAFYDPRFSKLSANEFNKISIEISILSTPEECSLEEINKGDGIIISNNYNSAVYLPQVWNQLSNKQKFLESLCNKAGLNYNCYLDKETKFKKFNIKSIK